MSTTPRPAGLNGRLLSTVTVAIAAAAAATLLPPLPVTAYKRQPRPQLSVIKPRLEAAASSKPPCFIPDKNGRKWPCSRITDPAANLTSFACPVENRLGADMKLLCDDDGIMYFVSPGDTLLQSYFSAFDPARPPFEYLNGHRTRRSKVTCEWWCAGNHMTGVVVWNEQWPEAWSCRKQQPGGGDGRCRVVFEGNREVVLVTRDYGRRVLGDVAVKECSKNWWGYGGWLPFSLGCTYPKHDHPYYGTVD